MADKETDEALCPYLSPTKEGLTVNWRLQIGDHNGPHSVCLPRFLAQDNKSKVKKWEVIGCDNVPTSEGKEFEHYPEAGNPDVFQHCRFFPVSEKKPKGKL